MDRRAYLAAAGLLLAGCSGTPGEETASATDTATGTSTPSPTASPTASPTDTETESPTPTEEPTPTATPEPSDVEIALRNAVADLDTALEEYSAPNFTFLETNARLGEFSQSSVRSPLSDAKGHLNTAEQEMDEGTPEELRTRHQRLLGVYWFFYWAGPVQTNLKDVMGDLRSVENAMYATDSFQENIARENVQEHVDEIDTNLDKLKRDSASEDATAPCALTEEQYIAKVDQFDAERGDISQLLDLFTEFGGVISNVASGLEDYNSGDYTSASATFYEASTAFAEYEESLSADDYQSPFEEFINRLSCVAGAMATGCDHLDTAATAGSNGNEAKRDAARSNAQDAFAECDIVFERVTPVAEFFGVDGQESLGEVVSRLVSPLFR